MLVDPGAAELGLDIWFTSRAGGISTGPYSSLDLGSLVGDDPAAVATNWDRAAAAGGLTTEAISRVRQVHGCTVVTASDSMPEADAIVLRRGEGGAACVLTADCVPVIIAGRDAIAVVHAGWRGLVAGVVEAAAQELRNPATAWIGPAIHACCYEVGHDVTDAFRSSGLPVAGDDRVDPARAATVALRRAGVDQIADCGICTSCDTDYFSHRRDGITGRQGAFARWI